MKKLYFSVGLLLTNIAFAQDFTQNTIGLTPATYAMGMVVDDLNNDGHLDVLINGSTNATEISVWFGDGAGAFGNRVIVDDTQVDPGSSGRDIAVLDVNNDGYLDIVAAISTTFDVNDRVVVWYPNNQDGTFGSRVVIDQGGWSSHKIIIFDVDNNGFDDIIINSRSTVVFSNYTLEYFPNNGDGTFGTKVAITSDGELRGLDSGFFNNDSFEDIVYMVEFDNEVKLLINNGDGTFTGPTVIDNTLVSANYVTVGKVNDDAFDDLIISEFSQSQTLSLIPGNGDGTFGGRQLISGGQFNQIINNAIADLDEDGDNDIVSAVQVQSDFVWFENDGSGGFGAANSISNFSSTNFEVAVKDINEDGRLDVIVTTNEGVYWYENNITLSTDEVSMRSAIKIGPNPTSDFLNIQANNVNIINLELYDSLGRDMKLQTNNFEQIDVTFYNPGIYFLKLQMEAGAVTRKIIID